MRSWLRKVGALGFAEIVLLVVLVAWATAQPGPVFDGKSVPGGFPSCTFEVYFSPYDNIQDVIHQELSMAKGPIFFSLYGIANPVLADDLIRIRKAGGVVQGGEDKLQAAGRSDLHALLLKAGVDLVIKPKAVLEHNKMAVIDDHIVILGSWNWSRSAQKQDNTDVVFRDCPEVTKKVKDAILRIIERDSPG